MKYPGHKPARWMTYEIFGRAMLPRIAGAYAVYFDDRLVYIGSSVDIANRFSEHKIRYSYGRDIITPWGDVPDTTRVTLKIKRSKTRGDWAMWEIRLIYRLKPLFNKRLQGRKAA